MHSRFCSGETGSIVVVVAGMEGDACATHSRHCVRSVAIHRAARGAMDCFAALPNDAGDCRHGATPPFSAPSGRAGSGRAGVRLPLRGIRSMSLTSLAPPLRRSSTILRLWNASSSARWATLTMVAFGSSSMTISIILSWLFSSSAEVASSSTMMSGLCSSSAREGEPLLFAARQRLVPRRLLLDPLLEMIQADLVQGLADLFDRPLVGRRRDRRRAAQRAGRDVGLLRQHEQPRGRDGN